MKASYTSTTDQEHTASVGQNPRNSGLPMQESLEFADHANYAQKSMPLLHYQHKRGAAPSPAAQNAAAFPGPINIVFAFKVFDFILQNLYSKPCRCGSTSFTPVKGHLDKVRCKECHSQISRLSHTPFRNLRIPQWMMGWLIYESIVRHPAVLTAAEITRRLGVNEKTALLMKRRLQLMAHDMRPAFQSLIREELAEAFPQPYKLPPDGEDVRPAVAGKPVVHADTMALFSASLRANKGRKRHKHKGLTASIYLSDKLGGRQVGTLAHVMGTEKGWVQIDSIPDLTANTVGPIIRKTIPRNAAIFTDEGYQWLYRVYPNHRMVNHSKKSKDKRYKMARDRWCQNGVHNQVSEGINGSLKIAMRGYRYFRPEHSNHYLMEWEFLRNLKYFGLDKIAEHIQRSDLPRRGIFDCADNGGGIRRERLLRRRERRRSRRPLRACE